jgi:hypothetical protein
MKKSLLLGCVLLVIALSVVAATTIKADAGNNPRQMVVDAKIRFNTALSPDLDKGERGYVEYDLYPEGQVVVGNEIGEMIVDFVATEQEGIAAAFAQTVTRIFEKGTIFGSLYHYQLQCEGTITGGTGELHRASGEFSLTQISPEVFRYTFNFDRVFPDDD